MYSRIKTWFKVWGDEFMVVFIYLGWTVYVQYNCYLNYGHLIYNIFTVGEPLVVTLGFYGLKILASEYRSMRDIEKDKKEHPEHYDL